VPQDLIYLAQAEQRVSAAGSSRAGARGIWQFVAWRGNEYGLRHTWWIDERQDPEKPRAPAAQHLRDLYGMFGDVSRDGSVQLRPGNVQKSRRAHRLRGFLGTLPAQLCFPRKPKITFRLFSRSH